MIISTHQPQYLPWLGYFDKIAKSDGFVFLDNVQYKHREFQNRNRIRTKDGWAWLTVPVVSKGLGRQKICDVLIDNSFDWQKKNWGTLNSCYGHAPFFKKYRDFFSSVYTDKWQKLIDLNLRIIGFLLKEFEISTPLYYESQMGISVQATDRIIEICAKLNADTYFSGVGAKAYLEEEKFARSGIKLVYQDFTHPVYHQQFTEGEEAFSPYMSAIDLLFNEGERSAGILKQGLNVFKPK